MKLISKQNYFEEDEIVFVFEKTWRVPINLDPFLKICMLNVNLVFMTIVQMERNQE